MGWRGLISRSSLPSGGLPAFFADGFQDAAHAGGHELVAVLDHGGAVDEALGDAHFVHFVAQGLLEPLGEVLGLVVGRARLLFLS